MTLLCPELQENDSKSFILLFSENGAVVGHINPFASPASCAVSTIPLISEMLKNTDFQRGEITLLLNKAGCVLRYSAKNLNA